MGTLKIALWIALLAAGGAVANPRAERAFQISCLDSEAIGYATFQSHNQKVVANRFGVFATHLHAGNTAYNAQTWRLSRSQDNGKTWTTLYEATHATNPPVLETDSRGNLYLVRADFLDGNAYLYRFLAKSAFRAPEITPIPGGSAGKYTLCLDEARKRLYFFAHNNTFHLLDLNGRVLERKTLIAPGKDALLQYPHLYLDQRGWLHAAWTTQKHGVYLYWDIHHILSEDGGASWRNMNGSARLSLPILADQTGVAQRITLDDEFQAHTWLSNFVVLDGKAHFLYQTQSNPPRQHYVRYDVATGTREADLQPTFQGKEIQLMGLDGFFATEGKRGSALYAIGNAQGALGCLVSRDNGRTWRDYARSEAKYHLYAMGGSRRIAADGAILGTFTDQAGEDMTTVRKSKVYFFRLPTR